MQGSAGYSCTLFSLWETGSCIILPLQLQQLDTSIINLNTINTRYHHHNQYNNHYHYNHQGTRPCDDSAKFWVVSEEETVKI